MLHFTKQRIRLFQKRSIKINQIHLKIVPILIIIITFIIAGSIILITNSVKSSRANDKNPHRSLVNYKSKKDSPFIEGCADISALKQDDLRANATFVILARNNELKDVLSSMESLERHFNQWFQYPYVFLNNVEFDENFQKIVKNNTNAKVEFGLIPSNHWKFENEDSWEFKESVEIQGDQGIMYGPLKNYHSMCRFYSGFFHKHELVRKYKWYWRVEPDVKFFCDLTYDPFLEMEKHGKKYGFTIMIKELWETVPNLFRLTNGFIKEQGLKKKSSWDLFVENINNKFIYNRGDFDSRYGNLQNEDEISDRFLELLKIQDLLKKTKKFNGQNDDSKLPNDEIKELITKASTTKKLPKLKGEEINGERYNLYHFWSNFEIARVDLWDNPIYDEYFQYLERTGGFYKERWGDAPIHSLALGFLLNLEEIHYFRDIGYQHTTIAHCPSNSLKNQLIYKQSDNFQFPNKKQDKFWENYDSPKSYGVGCRCKCPSGHKDIEDSDNDFLQKWFELNSDGYHKPRPININRIERLVRKTYRNGQFDR
ncbi:putative mannosyltransferase KTR5 [Wickerhamomyces ciferrii]|uniref:Mannosyltransferase KTR5 n=1 Tax=Wickerhamomyces ciferrii (strain ATCC 14091 / BCRC 22168 / CBS 111 / JCM 3599 / NBRC 0793 / NRRL Y-1031 F-60-10) TaxID=1206466 RepID=K0KAM3_WICCF|nr:putative mannosyltransferase KTR5 [Wickerhamomyces ciferrii]CCH42035.1 putative mannosyltransferase KTR5 [Wickerhamomyces ciferrii]